MSVETNRVCDLDDTWEDALDMFTQTIRGKSAWSCHCVDDVDKEVILSAPEIMDPKTDAGYGYENIYSLEHLLRSGQISLTEIVSSPEAMIDLMDFILVKELSYLRGYSVIHSFLAFPYFLCLDELRKTSPSLYVYCRGVLRGVDCVVRAVYATTIRSDEEFMLIPPELSRQLDSPVDELLADLDRAVTDTLARNTYENCDSNNIDNTNSEDANFDKTADPSTEDISMASSCYARLAERLRWRRLYVQALHLFLEAKSRHEVEMACGLCEELVALLDSAAFQRHSEPAVPESLQRGKEAAYWVSIFTPPSPPPQLSFGESMQMYRTMLTQLASLKNLFLFRSLQGITEFVEQLGAQQPLLPTRALAVVVLLNRDPNESFLYGLPLHQRILHTIAHDYGSPLYLRLFEGDQAAVESVVRYRVHRSMDIRKITPEQIKQLGQQTVDTVYRWTADACRYYLLHLETMLCNRGLAHRRLMNTMSGLCEWEDCSYLADNSIFLASKPGVLPSSNTTSNSNSSNGKSTAEGDIDAQCIRCSSVLTLYASMSLLRCMELVMQLYLELDLLTQGELLPGLWYVKFLQLAQAENMSLLCLQNTSFIPELRMHPKTRVPLYNLAIATRVAGVPDELTSVVRETSRMVSDVAFLSGCVMESKGLIDLTHAPKHALIATAEVFNHRMRKCFGCVRTPPVVTYEQCMATKPNLRKGSVNGIDTSDATEDTDDSYNKTLVLHAKRVSEVASKAAERARLLQQSLQQLSSNTADEGAIAGAAEMRLRRASVQPTLQALERTAKSLATSMACFAVVSQDEGLIKEYAAQVEKPAGGHLLCFAMRKKTARSA